MSETQRGTGLVSTGPAACPPPPLGLALLLPCWPGTVDLPRSEEADPVPPHGHAFELVSRPVHCLCSLKPPAGSNAVGLILSPLPGTARGNGSVGPSAWGLLHCCVWARRRCPRPCPSTALLVHGTIVKVRSIIKVSDGVLWRDRRWSAAFIIWGQRPHVPVGVGGHRENPMQVRGGPFAPVQCFKDRGLARYSCQLCRLSFARVATAHLGPQAD